MNWSIEFHELGIAVRGAIPINEFDKILLFCRPESFVDFHIAQALGANMVIGTKYNLKKWRENLNIPVENVPAN